MPYNGSGTFIRLYSWVIDAANSVNISSTEMDAEDNGFAAGLSNCITRDGQSPPSADIPWGGKKLTNLGLATSATDALSQAAGDTRYVRASATTLALSGALSAGSLTVSGNSSITGTLGVTGTATLGALNVSNDLALTANNHALRFTDLNGGNPFFIAKSDGSFAFYNTDGTGAQRLIFSQTCHSSSSTFDFSVAITAPTPAGGDNSTKVATTAFVVAALGSYAPLTSPPLSGTPTAPTAAAGTSTTQIATTAFVAAAKAPVVQSVASAATVTPTFSNDLVDITAQAVGLTLANPTGTAVNGWGIVVRIKDNGTPQTIAYGTQYTAIGVAKPTTTVAGKVLNLGMIYNANLTRWEIVSVAQE